MLSKQNVLFSNWLIWLASIATLIAVVIAVSSLVFGVRAGQRQLEAQRRQQILIFTQLAEDLLEEGNVPDALEAYRRITELDPGNQVATDALFRIASSTSLNTVTEPTPIPTQTTVSAVPTTLPSPTVAPTPTVNTLDSLWKKALAAYNAKDWEETLNQLLSIQGLHPDYEPEQIAEMLYDALVGLAVQRENAGNFEEAVNLFDQALLLRPGLNDLRRQRDIAATYLDILTYDGVDWSRSIVLLEELYEIAPSYRDVEVRLQKAYIDYSHALADEEEWCKAADLLKSATTIQKITAVVNDQDDYQSRCDGKDEAVAQVDVTKEAKISASTTPTSSAVVQAADEETADVVEGTNKEEISDLPTPVAAPPTATPLPAPSGAPTVGRILYAAQDSSSRYHIFAQPADNSAPAYFLKEDAMQPALRADGIRLGFRNMRTDLHGLSSFDFGTELQLRFSTFLEDSQPSWSPDGNRLVLASTREADRRSRIFLLWAEENGGIESQGFGESPEWHPFADQIAFRGCDETGNRCGLWSMSSNGTNRFPFTTVNEDGHPKWSPDGNFLVFMSNGRDGNLEIYRFDINSQEVVRLTNHPANDGIPTVSPDGQWVAFVSDRDGVWQIWAVPINGGTEQLIAPLSGGMPNLHEQNLQWVN